MTGLDKERPSTHGDEYDLLEQLPEGSPLHGLSAEARAHFAKQALRRASAAHPKLSLDPVGFLRHLLERLERMAPELVSGPPSVDGDELLSRIWVEDLYLAYGCVVGDAAALAAFEQSQGRLMERVCRRYASSESQTDDLKQQLREKLFVSTTRRPARIAEYSGKGYLENWLRVTLVRAAIDERRRLRQADREEPRDGWLEIPASVDFELDFIKRRYRTAFKQAFESAVGSLSSRERNLLRFQVLRRLTMDQMAALYHVHRATVVRQLAAARAKLLSETRKQLKKQLHLDRDEFVSLMRLLQSQLDVSLHRLLQSQAWSARDLSS